MGTEALEYFRNPQMNEFRKKSTIVIETSGGVVVAMYGDQQGADVVLVDWDEFHDDGRPGVLFGLDPLSKMPRDTRSLVERGLADVEGHEGSSQL